MAELSPEVGTLIMIMMPSNPEHLPAYQHRSPFALANESGAPRFLRLSQVIEMTGVGKTFIYTHMEKGNFPRQIQISPRTVVWLEQDIIDWMEKKIQRN